MVTSSAGAAVHDILRILRRRYPLSQVKLLPVRVQGVEAPMEIAGAIRFANAHKLCDVLIVGRGGGSMEDLWAFNEEVVARAIYDSEIPVISAVGHEPDVTISDFVADVRAATPSNAAELAVPDQEALRAESGQRQRQSGRRPVPPPENRPAAAGHSSQKSRPPKPYGLSGTAPQDRDSAVHPAPGRPAAAAPSVPAAICGPDRQAGRHESSEGPVPGYALAAKADGTLVRSASQVAPGDRLSITLHEGSITATVQEESK